MPQALDARAGPRPKRKTALHRGAREPGQRHRLSRQRIGDVGIDGQAAPFD